MTICHAEGCTNEPPLSKGGQARKWCSDRCRKMKYSVPCPGCGTMLSGSDGRSAAAPKLCQTCDGERQSIASGRAEAALEMWRLREVEQLNTKQIAERMYRPYLTVSQEMHRLRSAGFAVPGSPYNGAQKRVHAALRDDPEVRTLRAGLARLGVTPPDKGLPWR